MQHRFEFAEKIEGATVAVYEGEVTILADGVEWCLGAITLDALHPAGTEVALPMAHKLYERIALHLLQDPEERRDIDRQWHAFVGRCRQERAEVPR